MKIIKNKKMISSIVVIIIIITGLLIETIMRARLVEIIMKAKKDEGLNESIVATTALTTQVATITSIIEVTEVTTEQVTEKPIEKQIETTTVQVIETVSPTTKAESTKAAKLKEENISLYSASEFMNTGVIHWNGWKWTWYSEKVLAGEGLNIPNRHTDSNGYVCDSDGYICLASSVLSKGTVISTPFGKEGKVYDSGCASDVVDVYVSW